MKKTTLIIAWEGAFADLIARELALVGRNCVMAAADAKPEDRTMPWRPDSLASTRSVIIESLNVTGGFDEAILVAPYPRTDTPDAAHEYPGAQELCDQAAGFAMCAKELAARLRPRASGKLILIHPSVDLKFATPETAMAHAAIETFSRVFAEDSLDRGGAGRSAPEIIDVADSSSGKELVAQLALRLVDWPADRKVPCTVRFTGKPGIFNLF